MKKVLCKYKNKKRGFTLVELIAAIALFAIVTVSLLQLFAFSFNLSGTNQKKSQARYSNQTQMESKIANNASDVAASTDLTINFQGQSITVNGKIVDTTVNNKGTSDTFTSFIPNRN